ncbi:YpdA family putative bacillithiol disulfide reductase [Lentibacillus saliphilus]|uniref:YpdA family putative bacillithiol disulfide reductase n=1 Tax=Lentibacillus saliphilus TaxID=2737028 RepID=UPI001C2F0FBC|nr:YpdA family putative bacillithiol disulfide reductase [Lentibacillus saliphilus]
MKEQHETVIIVGGGPCGMSCAIELQKQGIDPLIIEKENVVHTIHQFPTHQTFFSSSDKLEIGDIPFITEKQKPVRNEALVYYRTVAKRQELRMNTFEKVVSIKQSQHLFHVDVETATGHKKAYTASYVVIATGYYDQPNMLRVPGEDMPKVMHYFKEAHPYFNKDVVVIGGKNSAVDAALELYAAGARVTVLYRGEAYSPSIKPWILPNFDQLVEKKHIRMVFNAHVQSITETSVTYAKDNEMYTIDNDFVFAMTGYRPDVTFLQRAGIHIDRDSGKPSFDEQTYETNISNIFIAGVVAAGFNNNKIFIENGRFHGALIATAIAEREDTSNKN